MMSEAQNKQAPMMIPAGGIAIFIEHEFEEKGAESDGFEEYGDEGIAQFPALTKKMAAMGREGDDQLAHVETGELIIPAAFFKDDPELKEMLFERFREMGVENPERYVVGSGENSVHPETGAFEFFLNKFFKNVSRGISNIVKGVVKVIKKVAPIILPIALGFTPLGPVFGAALGSGIGTLIQGGSIKDALKSALISGATGAVFAGFKGPGNFVENVGNAVSNPGARLSQTLSGAKTSFGNVFGGEAARAANVGKQTFFSKFQPTPDLNEAANQIANSEAIQNAAQSQGQTMVKNATGSANEIVNQVRQDALSVVNQPTVGEAFKDAFTPGGRTFTQSMGDIFFPQRVNAQSLLEAQGIDIASATQQQIGDATARAKLLNPKLIRSYGPMAALGTAAAAGAGFFETPETTPPGLVDRGEDGNVLTGADLIAESPEDYLIGDLGQVRLNPETGEYEPVLDTQSLLFNNLYQPPEQVESEDQPLKISELQADTEMLGGIAPTFNPNQYFLRESRPGGPFARPQFAADGGQIFPRRNGGIMPNEGIPGEDSVPAMLMPGEFVMTTDAVKGLGNGDTQAGIRNMYTVMANLERRGREYA